MIRIWIGFVCTSLMLLASYAPASAAATAITTALSPVAYHTTSGSDGGQPVSALRARDQSGTQNNWDKYVEFTTPSGVKYRGTRKYLLPAHITRSSLQTLRIKANYLGPRPNAQTWIWKIYNWNTRSWATLGDNHLAGDWTWTLLTFIAPGSPASYVQPSTREIRIRLQSSNALDNADLDYEAVIVTSNSQSIWIPAQLTSWQWQLSDLPVDQSVDATMYDIDLFENSAGVVASLRGKGRKVVCYMSAGSWENWRPDAAKFPAVLIGKPLAGWPGESWLDIRQLDILGPLMEARMDLCKTKGFDAVEVDNIDGYSNNTGFPLTFQDQVNYNIFLANAAHARGLSIALKNDLDQVKALLPYYDWALNEQCFQYHECDALLPFIEAGKAVFNVEYQLPTSEFCPQANALNFNSLKKHLDLDGYRKPCR
jgi:hypothetical protein